MPSWVAKTMAGVMLLIGVPWLFMSLLWMLEGWGMRGHSVGGYMMGAVMSLSLLVGAWLITRNPGGGK